MAQLAAIAATAAPVSSTRSCGRSSICSPRLPALTRIVSQPSALSSTVVGSRFRWPSGLIPPTTYPVVRSASARSASCARLPARAQVELAVGRHDEHAQAVRHRRDKRLEELRGVAPEGARHGDRVVAVVDVDAFVLVQAKLDARPLRGLDRRRHSASSSASSASANSRHASAMSAARKRAPSRATGRSRTRATSASTLRASCSRRSSL